MSSLDELATAIAAVLTQAEQTDTTVSGAIDKAGEVATGLAGLGAESMAQRVTGIGDKLTEARQHLTAFTQACNEATQMTEAAKNRFTEYLR